MTDPTRHGEEETVATPALPDSGSGKRIWRANVLALDEVLAERFRIVRFIARGGMGEVYEAEDRILRERVALKTIRSEVADEKTMERFLREVHLARSVTHPNVSRIFDVFHHGALAFLTMELLAGETLAERVKRGGRFVPEEALPLVAQMAAALAAAHEAGVIHRDFKSGNVMLVPDERRPGGIRVVVTDFGLARRKEMGASSAAPLTETEAVLGTPDYMAPEQIEGRDITPAADIYALGIVMYEMATGKPPFQGDTPLSVALKKLKEAAPSPRGQAPDLPPSWEKTILRCLERDPADRFSSATDVVRALHGEPIAPGPGQRARRRRLILGVTAGIALAALAAFFFTRPPRPEARSAPPPTIAKTPRRAIAVLGFKNLAGRPEQAWVSTALSEMMTTELAAGETVRAIPSEDVARMKIDLTLPETDALSRDTLARVRRSLGADVLLLGSYLAAGKDSGGAVRLDLRLQDAAAGETIAVISEKGTEADLDGLVTRAGARLREKLGLPAVSESEATAVRASLPANPEAQRLYAEGLAKLRLFDDVAARGLLEKAVAIEPGHALAHSALAAVWSSLGYDGKALAEAKTAFDRSANLTRETRLLVEGRYRAMANEWERAIEIYRSLFTFFPDNLDYGLQLAHAQTRAGKANEALATIASLRRPLARDDARIDMAEGETARALSDFGRVEKASARAAALGRAEGARLLVANALLLQSGALRNLGDPKRAMAPAEDARRLFEAAGDLGGVAAALNHLGNCRYDLGDLPGARQTYERVLAICREIGNQRAAAGALDNIASVAGDQGDFATAGRLSEEGLAIFREIGDKAGEAETLNNIGAALVTQGDFRGARNLFEQAVPLYRQTGDEGGLAIALNNIGEMQANQGDVTGAAANFAQSMRIFRDSGQKSKAVYPLVGLAAVRIQTGELAGVRTMLEEGLQICREADDRHESAYVLSSLGALALAEDRIADARRRYEEAFEVRNALGEKAAAAQSRLDLARVALEEGKAVEAERAARSAVEEFRRQKLPDDVALGLTVLARSMAALGRRDEAGRTLDLARALESKSHHDGVRREFLLISSIIRAGRGDSAASRQSLAVAIAKAKEKGLFAWELDARLALGEIEMRSGRAAEGRTLLSALEKDAGMKGFFLVARKARTIE